MAKEYFTEQKVDYTEYDVAADEAKRNEMVQMTGQMGVPVIVIADAASDGDDAGEGDDKAQEPEIVIGFDKGRIGQLLGL